MCTTSSFVLQENTAVNIYEFIFLPLYLRPGNLLILYVCTTISFIRTRRSVDISLFPSICYTCSFANHIVVWLTCVDIEVSAYTHKHISGCAPRYGKRVQKPNSCSAYLLCTIHSCKHHELNIFVRCARAYVRHHFTLPTMRIVW